MKKSLININKQLKSQVDIFLFHNQSVYDPDSGIINGQPLKFQAIQLMVSALQTFNFENELLYIRNSSCDACY
jgi:hypothetical protein